MPKRCRCDVCDEEYRKIDGEYMSMTSYINIYLVSILSYINIEIEEYWKVFQVYIVFQMFSEIPKSLCEQIYG